jgi:hypothetical protein
MGVRPGIVFTTRLVERMKGRTQRAAHLPEFIALSTRTPLPHRDGPPLRKRPRHLMDPNAPRPARDPHTEDRSLTKVQQWVMSTLAVTTLLHLSAGVIIAGMAEASPTMGAQIGLSIIAGAFGVMAVVAALAIHGRRILSWWLLLGPVPTAVGLWLIMR